MELIDLRYELAYERLHRIPGECAVPALYVKYFEEGADWFFLMEKQKAFLSSGLPLEARRENNHRLYEEILPGRYEESYADPSYAQRVFGREYGPILSALRYETRSVIPFVYRGERERVLIRIELFLEVYTAFTVAFQENGESPSPEQLRSIIRQYLADYAEDEMVFSIRNMLVEGNPRLSEMVSQAHTSEADLYMTGEYITDREIMYAGHSGGLTDAQAGKLADAAAEAYYRCFLDEGRNLASKKRASLSFHLGCERIARALAGRFLASGLRLFFPSSVPTLFHAFGCEQRGCRGADPNPQYYFDHREDLALFLNETLKNKKTEGLSNACRQLREKTVQYAGSLVLEANGPAPLPLADKEEALRCSRMQKRMCGEYEERADALYSEAVREKDSLCMRIGLAPDRNAGMNSESCFSLTVAHENCFR